MAKIPKPEANRRGIPVRFTLEEAQYLEWRRLAKLENRSLANWIRNAVEMALRLSENSAG